MEKTLEERVIDLVSLFMDFPEIMNLRFERMDSQYREVSGRLGMIDKQMAQLSRDMRDTRAGVTLQLREQDKRLERMEQRLGAMEQRQERDFDTLSAKFDQVLSKLQT